MPKDWPLKVQQDIEQWLSQWGFEGNPFATYDANKEKLLRAFFVDTGQLDWVFGDPSDPRTVLFFASRGCGKTAHRRMVESEALPANHQGTTLAVIYNEFDHWGQSPHPPLPDDHLRVILQKGLKALLETIVQWPLESDEWWSECFSELKQILLTFAPDLFQPVPFLRYLRRTLPSAAQSQLTLDAVSNAFSQGSLRSVIEQNTFLQENERTVFLAQLADAAPTDYNFQTGSLRPAMEILIKLSLALGLKAVYVLVDGVDEVKLHSLSWIDCLETLLSDLHLMNMPGLAFKFFLPAEKRDELLAKEWVRSDRLPYATLLWSKDDLKSLLQHRLRAFSSVGIESLKGMCEPRLARVIDDELVNKANGIPRRLLQLGQELLGTHCQATPPKGLLTHDEWTTAVQSIEAEARIGGDVSSALSYLYIDAKHSSAYIGERKIELTPNEHQFLMCLAENDGSGDKQYIAEHVYDTTEGVTDQAISSLVSRLRKKIELDPSNPSYIRTDHGLGFSLAHWKLKE